MMRFVHNVTLEVFSPPEKLGDAERALDALVPVPMAAVRETQWKWHPAKRKTRVYDLAKRSVKVEESVTEGAEDTIVVLSYRFAKGKDTAAFVARLREGLGPKGGAGLLADLDACIDEDGRLLLRLSKAALAEGEVRLMEREEFVMVRVNLAAFPKNRETCEAAAAELLGVNT